MSQAEPLLFTDGKSATQKERSHLTDDIFGKFIAVLI